VWFRAYTVRRARGVRRDRVGSILSANPGEPGLRPRLRIGAIIRAGLHKSWPHSTRLFDTGAHDAVRREETCPA